MIFFLIAWARATRHSCGVAREVPLADSQFLYLVPFILLKGCGLPLLLRFKDLFCLSYINPAKKRWKARVWLLWVVLPQLKMEKEGSVSRRWAAALGTKKILPVTKGFFFFFLRLFTSSWVLKDRHSLQMIDIPTGVLWRHQKTIARKSIQCSKSKMADTLWACSMLIQCSRQAAPSSSTCYRWWIPW